MPDLGVSCRRLLLRYGGRFYVKSFLDQAVEEPTALSTENISSIRSLRNGSRSRTLSKSRRSLCLRQHRTSIAPEACHTTGGDIVETISTVLAGYYSAARAQHADPEERSKYSKSQARSDQAPVMGPALQVAPTAHRCWLRRPPFASLPTASPAEPPGTTVGFFIKQRTNA